MGNLNLFVGNDVSTAAKNIELELKYCFPNIKFEIITTASPRFSKIEIMLENKDISVEEVKKITTKYELYEDHDEFPRSRPKVDCSFNEMHGGVTTVGIIPPFESKPHRIV